MAASTKSRCPNCGHLLDPGRLLTTAETAAVCGVSRRTVEGWRRTWAPERHPEGRHGPEPLATHTGTVRYAETTVRAWLATQAEAARDAH